MSDSKGLSYVTIFLFSSDFLSSIFSLGSTWSPWSPWCWWFSRSSRYHVNVAGKLYYSYRVTSLQNEELCFKKCISVFFFHLILSLECKTMQFLLWCKHLKIIWYLFSSNKTYALVPAWLPDWNLHDCITPTEILLIFSTVTIICYYMS